MAKILQGKVLSNKMQNTAVIEVSRLVPHPLYKKLIKKNKKYKVETEGKKLEIGQVVMFAETRPVSGSKHFKLVVQEKKVEKKQIKNK